MNFKFINILWFFTVFFASPLCVSSCERAMVVAGQKSVCGLQYRGSRIRTKNSNLIEKTVSE